MFRLPVELCLAVFSYLNVHQLLRAQQVCHRWQQIILDSSLWPSSVHVLLRYIQVPYSNTLSGPDYENELACDRWSISWPDWVDKEEESFDGDPQTSCQVLQTLSKGKTKSLSVNFSKGYASRNILEMLPNFLFLEELSVHIGSISSHNLTSVLQRLPQITTFGLHISEFHGTPMRHLKTIQLKLRRLFIEISTHSGDASSTLHNTVANIVEHSPDLISLAVIGTGARKEWTTKLGDRIKSLTMDVDGNLPPISARGLKCLMLLTYRQHGHELFECCACDLSSLTHLTLCGSSSGEVELSIMEAYNIGENLEFLHLGCSATNYELFLRSPKLKELRIVDMFPLHPDICPTLQMVHYCPDCKYIDKNDRKKSKLISNHEVLR